ncbi:MBL fold metallo-hydrolase [Gemmatimonadota bacterium]
MRQTRDFPHAKNENRLTVQLHRLLLASVGTSAFLLLACVPASEEPGSSSAVDYSVGTHVVLLGTGTPNADPERSGPAVAVIVNGTPYLVDAGPGVVRRTAAANAAGVKPLSVGNLRHLFLTHLHSDHTVGLPDVIFTPWVLERDVPLQLYGPSGSLRMVEHLLEAWEEDIQVRLRGLEPANDYGYQVDVHEIEPGLVFEDGNVKVTAIPVHHGDWEEAYGFRFESADRVVVISGDATPSDALVEACGGCDVLVHEVYSQVRFEQRPPMWQRYHADSHTSTVQLAELAERARPRLLVLYHQLFWGATEEEMFAEITASYDGVVISGRDLDVY